MIPLSFASSYAELDWPDVRWGYEHRLLSWEDVVEYAKLLPPSDASAYAARIAATNKNTAHFLEYVLAEIAYETETISKNKWKYLCVSWTYVNREKVAEPFEVIERIFADFGYPDDLAPLVRWMPPTDGYDPSKHSRQENMDRMLKEWRDYVDKGFMG